MGPRGSQTSCGRVDNTLAICPHCFLHFLQEPLPPDSTAGTTGHPFCPVANSNGVLGDPGQLRQMEAPRWDAQIGKSIVSLHSVRQLGRQWKGVGASGFHEHSIVPVLDPVTSVAGAAVACILLHDKHACFSPVSFNRSVSLSSHLQGTWHSSLVQYRQSLSSGEAGSAF